MFNGVLVERKSHATPESKQLPSLQQGCFSDQRQHEETAHPATDPTSSPRTCSTALQPLHDALAQGHSLIIFPEGTRNLGDELLPFKSGIYHLAKECPQVEFVPVWLENLHRVMPKGHVIPLPLLCTVNFGAPVLLQKDEAMDSKTLYLQRCRDALQALKPIRD